MPVLEPAYIGDGTIHVINPVRDIYNNIIAPKNISHNGIYDPYTNIITWTNIKIDDTLTFEFNYSELNEEWMTSIVTVPLTAERQVIEEKDDEFPTIDKPNPEAKDNVSFSSIFIISSLLIIFLIMIKKNNISIL